MKIAAIVLAGGSSSRLGRPKQLESIGGRPLVRRTAEAAVEAGCSPVVVVLGASAERVRPALDGLPIEIVVHAGWREGLGSSIRTGMQALDAAPEPDGVVLLACDQPALAPEVLRRLIQAFASSSGALVASAYAGTHGVPALFGRPYFEELRTLGGERGAKGLLERHADRRSEVAWPEGARDVDHPGDLSDGGGRHGPGS